MPWSLLDVSVDGERSSDVFFSRHDKYITRRNLPFLPVITGNLAFRDSPASFWCSTLSISPREESKAAKDSRPGLGLAYSF